MAAKWKPSLSAELGRLTSKETDWLYPGGGEAKRKWIPNSRYVQENELESSESEEYTTSDGSESEDLDSEFEEELGMKKPPADRVILEANPLKEFLYEYERFLNYLYPKGCSANRQLF